MIGCETGGSIARSMSAVLRFTEKNIDKIVIDISNKPVDNISPQNTGSVAYYVQNIPDVGMDEP